MKPYIICILTVIAASWMSSCKPSLERQAERAIKDSKARFPELPIEVGSLNNHYELVRSIKIRHPVVQMSLFEAKHEDGHQRIVVFTNAEGKSYALPWPTLRYKSYWNYVYGNSTKPGALKGGNFAGELNKALTLLQLNRRSEGRVVIDELLGSLLRYRYIRAVDTVIFNPLSPAFKDYSDSCLTMQRRTYRAVMRSAFNGQYWNSLAYLSDDGRIYQITNLDEEVSDGPKHFIINVYRKPCVLDVMALRL